MSRASEPAIDIRPLNRRIVPPRGLRRLFSHYVCVELTLSPWSWDIYYHSSGSDLTARVGPIGITVIDDGL